jgi:hypothetical protein
MVCECGVYMRSKNENTANENVMCELEVCMWRVIQKGNLECECECYSNCVNVKCDVL